MGGLVAVRSLLAVVGEAVGWVVVMVMAVEDWAAAAAAAAQQDVGLE